MPFDAPCNETGLSPSVPPQLAASTPDQQLQPGYFNCLPVEVIQHIANKLTLPDALRLKQTCHNANNSIDQKIIEDLRHRIQFKKALFVLQTADFINQAAILLWHGLAIFSQQFPEGIVYQGLWPIFIAEQSVTRKEPFRISSLQPLNAT
ncbi:F-box protein [Endozoicomonas sp. GU-1]|uniref:F-box protein n=1 Tax=Endozoicomonas sp. GU-1 TaxID=3009078 RepID=UPI0022B33DD7|nr:F-box protein [Endozoicomonas sp. GU-1]WBA82609.1 hypothetical protein O2T12_05570 [Endozoicomonas sp. GU-1]WBA85538.1 hypothetical protein O3276_20225 [Endozoicomonas sp. GU-1]